ncbi:Cytochrome P [Parasponia andersonii]|uniref:Cytochrome P n=1 Tax=Parasponia andersonii TaxID=3476 RepID=A0A2P5BFU3_PARAD|nr:Cytochrome P [Parasponia andersonii]
MFVPLFVSFKTTSFAITLAVKFLGEHPLVLKELTVIHETVRLANIVPGIFRKSLRDNLLRCKWRYFSIAWLKSTGNIVQIPGLQFPNGFQVQIMEKAIEEKETT